MKRKDYQKPTTRVVELQHRPMILAGSGENGGGMPGGEPAIPF